MTVSAVRAQAKGTPAKAAGAQVPKPVPPPAPAPSRRRQVPLTPMRRDAAKSMRKLAAHVQGSHPDMTVHEHLRDAARTLEAGNEEGAQRHLRAAMFALTPQSLMRNGLHTDDSHVAARDAMHSVHRHLLLVKDITDVAARNQEAMRRDSYGDDATSTPPPVSPLRADPNAGYGPGALAQKPTARQPPGNQALNAPAKTGSGGSDPAVADPEGPQPKGSKQFSYGWGDLAQLIELVGDGHGHHVAGSPMVYRHGFIPIAGTELGKDGIRRPGKGSAVHKVVAAEAVRRGIAPASRGAAGSQAAKTAPKGTPAAGNALRGDAAYNHIAEPAGKKERDAADYYSVGSGRLNPVLRNSGKLTDKTDRTQVRNLESAFAKAPPTTRHVVAYRGTTGALFGKGDATGTQFVDKGFTSVSTDQRQAGMFGSESDPALMEIHIPAGSKVLKPGAAGHYSSGEDAEKELVLNHGGRYEITSDQVVNDPQLGKVRKLTATYRGPA